MSKNVALILTDEDLQSQIKNEVRIAVQEAMGLSIEKKPSPKRIKVDIEGAISHLGDVGFKCSKSLIYKLTHTNEIPFEKFGRRIVFDSNELTMWAETRKQKRVDIAGNVSRSANFKLNAR